jgi:hypothetical protein
MTQLARITVKKWNVLIDAAGNVISHKMAANTCVTIPSGEPS